jgi:hypothetical protein
VKAFGRRPSEPAAPSLIGPASETLHKLRLGGEGRSWRNPDMPTPLLNVRYRARSGKHLLAASISAFDPEPTFDPT